MRRPRLGGLAPPLRVMLHYRAQTLYVYTFYGSNDAAWLLLLAVRSALPKLRGSTDLSGQVATVDVPGKERA
jgi:hypothetical protein